MPITQITPNTEIDAHLTQKIKSNERAIINALKYAGEMCVREGREEGRYIDRTGNLRSSIGYVIIRDGSIVESSGFETIKDGGTGATKGKQIAADVAGQFPTGIALIVSAGMEYAGYVEALGYDVLTSSELLAARIVPQLLTSLGFKTR